MKRKIIFGLLAVIIFVIAFVAMKFYGSAVSTPSGEFFYIKTGSTYEEVQKELVDKNKGQITYHNNPGGGSIFKVTLSLA